ALGAGGDCTAVVCDVVGDQLGTVEGEFEGWAGAGKDCSGRGGGGGGVGEGGEVLDVCVSLSGDGAQWDGTTGWVGRVVLAGDAGCGARNLCGLSGKDFWGDAGITANTAAARREGGS